MRHVNNKVEICCNIIDNDPNNPQPGRALVKLVQIIAVVAVAFSATTAWSETVWQMPTPYPEANFHTQNILQFAKDVETATNGDLKIVVHPAGSLIKHAEIKNAVRSAQVEAGEFILSGLANESPIFALDSVPFVATSYPAALKLYNASKADLTAELERQNIVPLFSVPWPGQGLYTDRAIDGVEDLQGLKMRAYSPQTERLAQAVGAVPTQVEVPDLAQAFTTGRINAMITSTSTGVNTSAWDYLTHFYDVSAFLPKNIVVVNKAALDSLSPDNQQAVRDAAAEAEIRGWKMSEDDHKAMRDVLIQHGIEVLPGSDALNSALVEIGAQLAAEWSAESGEAGAAVMKAFQDAK
jgi:TRAP-type C4-dicarboxylate transport system substrate-binding protein